MAQSARLADTILLSGTLQRGAYSHPSTTHKLVPGMSVARGTAQDGTFSATNIAGYEPFSSNTDSKVWGTVQVEKSEKQADITSRAEEPQSTSAANETIQTDSQFGLVRGCTPGPTSATAAPTQPMATAAMTDLQLTPPHQIVFVPPPRPPLRFREEHGTLTLGADKTVKGNGGGSAGWLATVHTGTLVH